MIFLALIISNLGVNLPILVLQIMKQIQSLVNLDIQSGKVSQRLMGSFLFKLVDPLSRDLLNFL